MARQSLITPEKVAEPKIIVNGESTTNGRLSTLLRIRPTLMERVKRVSVGPMYLIIEHALERLAAEAEKPNAKLLYIPGYQMNPTQADIDLLTHARANAAQLKANEGKGPTAKSVRDAAAAKKAPARKAAAKAPRKAAKA